MSILRKTLTSGAIAAVATTVAAILFARRERRGPAEVLNSTSHVLWGDEAFAAQTLDLKHTVGGVATNAAAVTSWALLSELLLGKKRTLARTATIATAVSAAAAVVDYVVVPKRLTPGFEEKLSKKSLAGLYVVLAVALLAGGLKNNGH